MLYPGHMKKLKKYFQDDIAIKKIMIENSTQEIILIDWRKSEIWEKFKYRDSRK